MIKLSYLEDRLYNEAFNDGFNYAIEKLFAEEDDEKKPKKWPYAVGGAVAGTVGGGLTAGMYGHHLMCKDLKLDSNAAAKLASKNPKAYEKLVNLHFEKNPSAAFKVLGAGLGAAGALGVAAPMALYHYRKNKLNKKERD